MADDLIDRLHLVFYESMQRSQTYPYFMRHLADQFENGTMPHTTFYGAETMSVAAIIDGKIVGLVAFNLTKPSKTGWIVLLAVTPQFRALGIARRLHAEAERHLARLGATAVSSTIHVSNEGALAVSTSAGCTPEFTRMTKRLPKAR